MLRTNVEALHELAGAAPSVQPSWDEDDPLPYIEVGDLVRHLRAKLAKGEILGPLSRGLWDELNDFWGGSTTAHQ